MTNLRNLTHTTPGAAAGLIPGSPPPAMSAFPGRVAGSACTSSFSRLARRLLALRPAHSRGHQFVTRYPKASDISSPPCLLRLLPAGANRRVGLAPTGKRRLVTAHTQSSRSLPATATGNNLPTRDFEPTSVSREVNFRRQQTYCEHYRIPAGDTTARYGQDLRRLSPCGTSRVWLVGQMRISFGVLDLSRTSFLSHGAEVNFASAGRRIIKKDTPAQFMISVSKNEVTFTFERELHA